MSKRIILLCSVFIAVFLVQGCKSEGAFSEGSDGGVLNVTSADATVVAGKTTQFIATGQLQDGTTQELSNNGTEVLWEIEHQEGNGTPATIDEITGILSTTAGSSGVITVMATGV